MRKQRRVFKWHFYTPYSCYYDLLGLLGALLCVFVVFPSALYFPVIKPNIEQQKSVKSQIEQNIIDYSYVDVSEFSSHSNAYKQCQEYDGKIVSFTGLVGTIRGTLDGEYGESVVSIYS